MVAGEGGGLPILRSLHRALSSLLPNNSNSSSTTSSSYRRPSSCMACTHSLDTLSFRFPPPIDDPENPDSSTPFHNFNSLFLTPNPDLLLLPKTPQTQPPPPQRECEEVKVDEVITIINVDNNQQQCTSSANSSSSSPSTSSSSSSLNSSPAAVVASGRRFFFSPSATGSILEQVKRTPHSEIAEIVDKMALEEEEKRKEEEKKIIGRFLYEESVKEASMVSENPYCDFRESMVEMVEAHGLHEWGKLQELLQCYLRLNDKKMHRFIVCAFIDLLFDIVEKKKQE